MIVDLRPFTFMGNVLKAMAGAFFMSLLIPDAETGRAVCVILFVVMVTFLDVKSRANELSDRLFDLDRKLQPQGNLTRLEVEVNLWPRLKLAGSNVTLAELLVIVHDLGLLKE